MSDVFISYKRRLRPVVERLAEALRALKISVWFDARLEPGAHFSDEIAREVRGASCVLVAWSNDAFPHGGDANAWVRGEATIGQERKVLVSVQVEPVSFDPPWNMMHHEDLIGWATPRGLGNPRDPRWLNVLEAIGRKIGRPGLAAYVDAKAIGEEALADWAASFPNDPLAVPAGPSIAAPGAEPVVVPRRYLTPWIVLGVVAAIGVLGGVFYATMGGRAPPPAPPVVAMPPQQQVSAFKTTLLGYCRETPETLVYECGCFADVLERELDATTEAIFLIIAKPGASGDPQAVNRLLRDAGYSQGEIDAADLAVPKAVAKVQAECPKTERVPQP